MKRFFLGLALTAVTVKGATAQPASALQVDGDVVKPSLWTIGALQKIAPIQTIKTTLKGKPYVASGVPLWALVSAAMPRLDSKAKHSEARFVVLARGKDGYMASFALPDLMPDTGNKGVFVAWSANGKPLSPKDGPFRLVVPSDKKPMRWVHSLVSIEIYDGKRLVSAGKI